MKNSRIFEFYIEEVNENWEISEIASCSGNWVILWFSYLPSWKVKYYELIEIYDYDRRKLLFLKLVWNFEKNSTIYKNLIQKIENFMTWLYEKLWKNDLILNA